MKSGVHPERVQILNTFPTRAEGQYVLYAMRSAQRVHDNPALTLAALRANELGKPLLVAFCLTLDFPEANLRHFTFLLEGLAETLPALRRLGAHTVLLQGRWDLQMSHLAEGACEVVLDKGYLRQHRDDVDRLTAAAECRMFEVEGEAIVPVQVASDKLEYAARTLRPRVHRHLKSFLVRADSPPISSVALLAELSGLERGLEDLGEFLQGLQVDRSVAPVSHHFQGGPHQAQRRLENFLSERLHAYQQNRSQPQRDFTSGMSLYLHYGMISPVDLALRVTETSPPKDPQAESYLEELVVRRGLSQNYCLFQPHYDQWIGLPEWARRTLVAHSKDFRPHLYSRESLENAQTHDPYWNAAQTEMVQTGYMHNHMRMYWGKKILEWSATPEEAYRTTLELNNRYFLDGRDPASFANVGWIFGLHDRPWKEREIYGTVRCMMASGLERKCDPKAYVAKVERLSNREAVSGERPESL